MAGGGGLVAMLSSGSSATNKEPFRRKNWQKCPFASINVLKQPVEFKSKIFTAHTVCTCFKSETICQLENICIVALF